MKLFRDLLHAHDYTTVVSTTGMDAVDLAREHRPDLIIMDCQLPEQSGLELTVQLKADDELKHIPVIACTAFAMKVDEDKIRAAGCDDYISKPISVPSFLDTIASHLSAPKEQPD